VTRFIDRLKAVIKAAHAGPTAVVTLISYLLVSRLAPQPKALAIALTVFLGQLIVGWSNDLIDFPKDGAADRTEKPLVNGAITFQSLRTTLFVDLPAVTALSLFGPMGFKAGACHLLAIGCAVSYNFYFKRTIFSWLPYAISFALLPTTMLIATNRPVRLWIVIAGAALGIAASFANVVKDVESDRVTGILGAPQRIGEKNSRIVSVLSLMLVATLLTQQVHGFVIWVASLFASSLVLFGPKKLVFPVLMALAVIDVSLLLQTISK
jgi:4-hydroxybenzoate polyprenyltransferase